MKRSFKTFLLLVLMISFCSGIMGQQTDMDLRKDGDILTEKRKDFFLENVSTSTLSPKLRNQFATSRLIRAIVVPSDKLEKGFFIGVVKGFVLVPEDWPIEETDFKFIRAYCKTGKLGEVEKKYEGIRKAVGSKNSKAVDEQTDEMRKLFQTGKYIPRGFKFIEVGSKERGNNLDHMAALYAGYLLQDFDKSPDFPKFSDIVAYYREEKVKSIEPFVKRAIDQHQLAWSTPFQVTGLDQVLTLENLSFSEVKRRPIGDGRTAFLTLWSGTALVIVAEKPKNPFVGDKYKNLVDYLGSTNPKALDSAIPMASMRPN